MKRLYVFVNFDWLKEPKLIGELSYEFLRGFDSYGFTDISIFEGCFDIFNGYLVDKRITYYKKGVCI